MRWREKDFVALTASELYGIMARSRRVFTVAQACAFFDADGCDPQ